MEVKRVQSIRSMSQLSEGNSSGSIILPAAYRFNILDNARTHLRWGPPPEKIQHYINSVIKAQDPKDTTPEMTELFEKRVAAKKDRILPIAQQLMEDFRDVLDSSVREGHSVEPIFTALKSMDPDKKLGLLRKAGIIFPSSHFSHAKLYQDWDKSLKPRETDDYAWIRPRKRQQAESISETTQPPAPKADSSLVKTPRPDITVGPRHNLFVHTLVERAQMMEQKGILRPGCWTKGYADRKLKTPQDRGMLISDPTRQGIIRFPAMAVEGKAYSTGKQVLKHKISPLYLGLVLPTSNNKISTLPTKLLQTLTAANPMLLPSKHKINI